MSPVFLALALLGAPPDDVSGPTTNSPPPAPLRRVLEITRDVDELVRRESRVQSDEERAVVAYEMTQLYSEIKRDPRLVVSDSLKEAKLRMWSRLTRIKKDVQAKLKREGRPDETLTDEEVLALADIELVTQSLADHFALADSTLGGPATLLGQANSGTSALGGSALGGSARGGGARGGGGAFDYGPSLVDLIQRTIVPDFWDVNGGPGTIVYYRPLMCLVVRATSDVHHRIGGAVGAIRDVR